MGNDSHVTVISEQFLSMEPRSKILNLKELTMLKRTRHALAVLLPLIFIMPVLLSCGGAGGGGTTLDGGYLGNTPTLEGPLYVGEKGGI